MKWPKMSNHKIPQSLTTLGTFYENMQLLNKHKPERMFLINF